MSFSSALELRPEAGLQGLLFERPWTALTSHLVHVSPEHFLLNLVAMLLVLLVYAGPLGARRLGWAALASALGATAAVLALHGDLSSYRGFSGVAHGIFAAGAAADVRRAGGLRMAGLIALATVATKIGLELSGATLDTHLAGDLGLPTPFAHLGGALAGAAYGICCASNPLASAKTRF